MSYCRWSDMQYTCDIYAFHHVQGTYEVWVAERRHTSDKPKPLVPPYPIGGTEEQIAYWVDLNNAFSEWMEQATLVPIGLPHDGEMFSLSSPEDAADKMEELKAAGYHVPQYAIDALREEAKDEAT
jgi:hypothetical protein